MARTPLAALLITLLPAGSARAAVVQADIEPGDRGGDTVRLRFEAAPGERNVVTLTRDVGGTYVVRDLGAPLAASAGCASLDANTAACAAPLLTRTRILTLSTGDLDDAVTTGEGLWAAVEGGDGDDVLRGSGGLDGGPGADTLEGGAGHDRLVGAARDPATDHRLRGRHRARRAGPGHGRRRGTGRRARRRPGRRPLAPGASRGSVLCGDGRDRAEGRLEAQRLDGCELAVPDVFTALHVAVRP